MAIAKARINDITIVLPTSTQLSENKMIFLVVKRNKRVQFRIPQAKAFICTETHTRRTKLI